MLKQNKNPEDLMSFEWKFQKKRGKKNEVKEVPKKFRKLNV